MPISVSELARRWGCGPASIYDQIRAGKIEATAVNPLSRRPTWRISLQAVERIEERRAMAYRGQT